MKNKKPVPVIPPLEPVHGSTCCEFSVVENKLAALYRNQQKIYTLLQKIAANTTAKSPGIQSVLAEIEKPTTFNRRVW